MAEYSDSSAPGMVSVNGKDENAAEVCEALAERVETLKAECEELQSELQQPCWECRERDDEKGDLEDQVYRVKYAPNSEAAIKETQALFGMIVQDTSWLGGVLVGNEESNQSA